MNNLEFDYFDVESVLSRGILANFVLSERGAGKTHSAKKKVIKRFRNKGRRFLFLKRTEEELKATVHKFWGDYETDTLRFKYHRNTYYIGDRTIDKNEEGEEVEEIVWKEFGYAIALSTLAKLKGISLVDVDIILWDEFVPFDGRYLPDEADRLLNVLETVFRMRDDGQLIALGNKNETGFYPLFHELGLPITSNFEDGKIYTFKQNTILIYSFTNENHVKAKLKTKIGKLAKGTSYEQSMINNVVEPKFNDLVMKKPTPVRKIFSIVVQNEIFAVNFAKINKNILTGLYICVDDKPGSRLYTTDNSMPTVPRLSGSGFSTLYGYIVGGMARFDSQVTAQKVIQSVNKKR